MLIQNSRRRDSHACATWDILNSNGVSVAADGVTVSYAATNAWIRATMGKSTGSWYWEVKITSASYGSASTIGVGTTATAIKPGIDTTSYGYMPSGSVYALNVSLGATSPYTTLDVIGVLLNMDLGTLSFYTNGVLQGFVATGLTGTLYPMLGVSSIATTWLTNFGQTSFAYPVPSGANSGVF